MGEKRGVAYFRYSGNHVGGAAAECFHVLKKLALAKFRAVAKHEANVAKTARTIQRFKEIDETHDRMMKIAKEKSSVPMKSRKVPEQERPIDYVDEGLAEMGRRVDQVLAN